MFGDAARSDGQCCQVGACLVPRHSSWKEAAGREEGCAA